MPETAVCLVGELRAVMFPQVRDALRYNVLLPLKADAFAVYTRSWTDWQMGNAALQETAEKRKALTAFYSRSGFDRHAAEVSVAESAAIFDELRPVAIHETPDQDVLWTADGQAGWMPVPPQTLNGTRLCGRQGPLRPYSESRTPPYGVPCLHALRCVRCLQLVEASEQQRMQPYTWVLRTRPDIFIGCRWQLPVSAVHRDVGDDAWVAYGHDYAAFMPRRAAKVALGYGIFANSVHLCDRNSTGFSIGCNACMVRAYNFSLVLLASHCSPPKSSACVTFGGDVDVARQCALKSWETSSDAAFRRGSGFSTPTGACHSSIKNLTGPDLSSLFKRDGQQVCMDVTRLPANPDHHYQMSYVVKDSSCRPHEHNLPPELRGMSL